MSVVDCGPNRLGSEYTILLFKQNSLRLSESQILFQAHHFYNNALLSYCSTPVPFSWLLQISHDAASPRLDELLFLALDLLLLYLQPVSQS